MVVAADYPLMEIFWTMLVFFGYVLWFALLFRVFGDLFRRDDVSGFGKFAWSVLVIVVPILGSFAYLISQGSGMMVRELESRAAQQAAFDDHIRKVAANGPATGVRAQV
jgi:Phospholipase_D-nuclease N-terminal